MVKGPKFQTLGGFRYIYTLLGTNISITYPHPAFCLLSRWFSFFPSWDMGSFPEGSIYLHRYVHYQKLTNMDPKNDALEEECPFNYGEFGCPCWVFLGGGGMFVVSRRYQGIADLWNFYVNHFYVNDLEAQLNICRSIWRWKNSTY